MQSVVGRIGSCQSCNGMNDVVHVSYFLRATHPNCPYHLFLSGHSPSLAVSRKAILGPSCTLTRRVDLEMLVYKQTTASVTLAQFVNTRPTSRWKAISAEPSGTIVFQWRPVSNSQGNRWPPSDSFIFIVTHYDTSATSVLIAKIHFDALCLSYPSNYCFYLSTSSAAATCQISLHTPTELRVSPTVSFMSHPQAF